MHRQIRTSRCEEQRGERLDSPSFVLGLVGPAPPPYGGMANQAAQLQRLLESDGKRVSFVKTNREYRPRWIANIKVFRALARLFPYFLDLWRTADKVTLFHVFSNSGLSWFLFTVPVVLVGVRKRVPIVINYRGGQAQTFLSNNLRWVRPTLQRADLIVVPSGFLAAVFADLGVPVRVVENIVDLERFSAAKRGKPIWHQRDRSRPHLVVTRNLEAIYAVDVAIRAFSLIRRIYPDAILSIAGEGEQLGKLRQLSATLGLLDCVHFLGRMNNDEIAELYQTADVMLNSSLVDNMPISVLEALASGVPVVTTDVGGIPFIVEHDRTALLVPPHDADAMARETIRLLDDPELFERLIAAGAMEVARYSWQVVREKWEAVYAKVISQDRDRRR